jgi:hypothetical protein
VIGTRASTSRATHSLRSALIVILKLITFDQYNTLASQALHVVVRRNQFSQILPDVHNNLPHHRFQRYWLRVVVGAECNFLKHSFLALLLLVLSLDALFLLLESKFGVFSNFLLSFDNFNLFTVQK